MNEYHFPIVCGIMGGLFLCINSCMYARMYVYLCICMLVCNCACMYMCVRLANDFINVKTETKHSFIHSGHFNSAPSSPLLLRGAPDYTARILYRSFTPKRTGNCR